MELKSCCARDAISVFLVAFSLATVGCGSHGTTPTAQPNTYLYVGGSNSPFSPLPLTGSIYQFGVESDGSLTALNTSTTGPDLVAFAATVPPGSQRLFASNWFISEFDIGSDGILGSTTASSANGNAIAFTPNGQFAMVTAPWDNSVGSFALSSSGMLTAINTVATGGDPQNVAVDGAGRFAYVANWNDGTISQYTISADGALAANGSISTGGANPATVVVSPGGFLYCANSNSASVSEFSIDSSNGSLILQNMYAIAIPKWISFDPAGAHVYIGNLNEVAQYSVDGTTGALTSEGTISVSNGPNWGGVDPSGRFLFTANADGSVSQFTINSIGNLVSNGSVSTGSFTNSVLTFAQR